MFKNDTLYIAKEQLEDLTQLMTSYLCPETGAEYNNPKPLHMDSGLDRPPTLAEQIDRVMRRHISNKAMDQGFETLEESQDFSIDDAFENSEESIYQIVDEEIPVMDTDRPPANEPSEPTDYSDADPGEGDNSESGEND